MAGTITQASSRRPSSNIMTLTLTCTADAANGSYPATLLDEAFVKEAAELGGWVQQVETWPGDTAPTDASDLAITNENSLDILGGAGTDRVDATSQLRFMPKDTEGGYSYYPITLDTALTAAITGNSVNSAVTYVRITVSLVSTTL